MIATFTVIPGTVWLSTDNVSDAKLNLTANPTVTGAVTFADGTSDAVVTPTSKTFTVQDASTDLLRVAAGHGMVNGQRVKVSSSFTLPTGLVAGVEYFVRLDGSNPTTDFTLHYTAIGASTNIERVDVTTAGSGTHTATYYNFATGHAWIFDASGNTWEKGIVSPESMPEMVGATTTQPGTRGAVPQPGPGPSTDYLARDGAWKAIPSFSELTGLIVFNRLNFS